MNEWIRDSFITLFDCNSIGFVSTNPRELRGSFSCLPLRNSAMRRRLHQVKIVTPPDGSELSPPYRRGSHNRT